MTGPSTMAHHKALHERVTELEAELADWKLHAPYSWAFEAWKKAEAEVERLKGLLTGAANAMRKLGLDKVLQLEGVGRESGPGGQRLTDSPVINRAVHEPEERAQAGTGTAANPAARRRKEASRPQKESP